MIPILIVVLFIGGGLFFFEKKEVREENFTQNGTGEYNGQNQMSDLSNIVSAYGVISIGTLQEELPITDLDNRAGVIENVWRR